MSKVIVQSLPDYAHAQLITADGHATVADEPRDEGGDGLGPDPYELLLSALGACTAMTIQMYARRKGYPLHEVAVEVEHERNYTHDRDTSDDEEPWAERMHRRIVLRGDLTPEQRDDLLRVARRCPVHRTLAAAPKVLDTVDVVG